MGQVEGIIQQVGFSTYVKLQVIDNKKFHVDYHTNNIPNGWKSSMLPGSTPIYQKIDCVHLPLNTIDNKKYVLNGALLIFSKSP